MGSLQSRFSYWDYAMKMRKLSITAKISDPQTADVIAQLLSLVKTRNPRIMQLHNLSNLGNGVETIREFLWNPLFACHMLDELSLRNFVAKIPSSTPILASSLRKLTLFNVVLDEESLYNLLSGLPVLQDLVLKDCRGFSKLHVCCPKLGTLKISFNHPGYYATPVVVSVCKLLKTLHLNHGSLSAITSGLEEVSLLENLTMHKCKAVFKIANSNLESLVLDSCLGMKVAEFDTPKLGSFIVEKTEC